MKIGNMKIEKIYWLIGWLTHSYLDDYLDNCFTQTIQLFAYLSSNVFKTKITY
ncbi:MAG: hypothetical protein ACRDCH_01710 [Metamycoplasmataceae bacterium]